MDQQTHMMSNGVRYRRLGDGRWEIFHPITNVGWWVNGLVFIRLCDEWATEKLKPAS